MLKTFAVLFYSFSRANSVTSDLQELMLEVNVSWHDACDGQNLCQPQLMCMNWYLATSSSEKRLSRIQSWTVNLVCVYVHNSNLYSVNQILASIILLNIPDKRLIVDMLCCFFRLLVLTLRISTLVHALSSSLIFVNNWQLMFWLPSLEKRHAFIWASFLNLFNTFLSFTPLVISTAESEVSGTLPEYKWNLLRTCCCCRCCWNPIIWFLNLDALFNLVRC